MKKICCLIAALLLLCAAASASAGETEDAVAILLDRLSACFDTQEQINVLMTDGCQKAGVFFERADYASLVRARLACSENAEALRGLGLPQLLPDEKTLLLLMQRQVETVGLEDKAQDMSFALQDGLRRLEFMESFLHSAAVYVPDGLAAGKKLTDGMLKTGALRAAYDCCWLNDLLLPLGNDPQITAFWEQLPLRWPLTAQYRLPWTSDPAALADQGAAILTEMEAALDEMAALDGMSAGILRQYAQNPAAAGRQLPHGMPPALPLPDFWQASTARSLHAGSGANGAALPDTLIWRFENVSSEQFLSYAAQLSRAGLAGEATGSDQDGWKASLNAAGKALLLIWRPGGVAMVAYNPNELTLEVQ